MVEVKLIAQLFLFFWCVWGSIPANSTYKTKWPCHGMPKTGTIYKIFDRKGYHTIRRDVFSGLVHGLTGRLLCPLVAGRIREPRGAGRVAPRVLKGFGSQSACSLATGSILVPGQLYWYKPAKKSLLPVETHYSILSKAISIEYFLMWDYLRPASSANYSPWPSHGLLPDQTELLSTYLLDLWKTNKPWVPKQKVQ